MLAIIYFCLISESTSVKHFSFEKKFDWLINYSIPDLIPCSSSKQAVRRSFVKGCVFISVLIELQWKFLVKLYR